MNTRREFLGWMAGAAVLASWGKGGSGGFMECGRTQVLKNEPREAKSEDKIAEVPEVLDHILLGCGDLESGIAWVEERTGVKAAFGGVHPGRGTQNALLSLGERHYLEIIAPDPQQSGDEHASRLQKMTAPQLIGWAIHPGNLQEFATRLARAGIATNNPTPGSRKRPDGITLQWTTLSLKNDGDGALPFCIEWGTGTVHPSADAPKGCALKKFWAESPKPDELTQRYAAMGLSVGVKTGEKVRLRAGIAGPKGEAEL